MYRILSILLLLSVLTAHTALLAEPGSPQLGHWDQAVRRQSLQSIQQSPEKYATGNLVQTVAALTRNDKNCGVRTEAAKTLATLAPHIDISGTQQQLLQALRDPIHTVREAALTTLCFPVTGQASTTIPQETMDLLLEDPRRQVRIVAKRCQSFQSATRQDS